MYCRLWLLLRRAMKVHWWRKEKKLCWSLTSSRGKDDVSNLHCNTGVLLELCPPKGVLFEHIQKWFVLTKTCVRYKLYSSSVYRAFIKCSVAKQQKWDYWIYEFLWKKGDVVGIIKRPRHQQKTHNIDGLLMFQHNVCFSIYILKSSHKLYALYWFSYFIAVHNNA